MIPIKQSVLSIFKQLIDLIEKIDESDYKKPILLLSGNTIGKHIRHVIEFYLCLKNSLEIGIIDYDGRPRDLELETDKRYTLTIIQNYLDYFENHDLNYSSLHLKYNPSTEEEKGLILPTYYFRELAYNIEHSIHHMAIIKIAIQHEFPHIELEENFGLAYSTIKHQVQTVAC
jgi:hypothetical protein